MRRTGLVSLLIALAFGPVAAATATAQPRPAPSGRSAAGRAAPFEPTDQNARETRDELYRLLEQYPPSLAQVLKLDPTLLTNRDYLAPYPALAAFLAVHPEVAHNPAFFLGGVRVLPWDNDPVRQATRMWQAVLAGIAVFIGVVTVLGVLGWLIRTLIDHRRWLRLSKVQTEVHNKLLDRFTANEDLLSYVQTPAGQRFLQSAPIPIDVGPRTIGAPVGRILWSIQAGVVLALAGVGLQFASPRVVNEIALPLWVIGVLALAVGAGFVLSAVVAYAISRRLGLFEPPPQETRRESLGAPIAPP
jgi:hypothetical protein